MRLKAKAVQRALAGGLCVCPWPQSAPPQPATSARLSAPIRWTQVTRKRKGLCRAAHIVSIGGSLSDAPVVLPREGSEMMSYPAVLYVACVSFALIASSGCEHPWRDSEPVEVDVPAIEERLATAGVRGFRVTECGLYTVLCELDKPIVVDTSVRLRRHDHPAPRTVIEVEDPTILALEEGSDADGFGLRAWGLAPGKTRLLARSSAGTLVDAVEVSVVDAAGLAIAPLDARMVREADIGETQLWRLPADEVLTLYLVPEVEDYRAVMGKIDIEVVDVGDAILSSMVELGHTHVEMGTLAFEVPEGEHPFIVQSPDGVWSLRARFQALPTDAPERERGR